MKRKDGIALLLILAIWAAVPDARAAEPAEALYTVSARDVEEAVEKSLAEKGLGERMRAVMQGLKSKQLYGSAVPMEVEIKGLQFDESAKRWTANLLFLHQGQALSAMPASGRYQEMALLPVLKRGMKYGELIAETDIDYAEFPKTAIRSETVEDPAKMVGLTPRRMVSAGRPVRLNELAQQTVIKKNAAVQMNYKTGTMEISLSGQALEAGSVGDVIPVRNLSSKQTIRAVVVDARNVDVAPLVQSSALIGGSRVN